jgi:hypothetical protein
MAINFPSTAGQATDGSYTYTVAGITYAWDGTSWEAAGAGASATDRTLFSVTQNAAGTAALSYNSNTGVFSYTPPNLTGLNSDTLQTVTTRGATTDQSITIADDKYLYFGTHLQIRNRVFNGTFNYGEITHTGDSLTIQSNNFVVDAVGGTNMLDAVSGGAVSIYYNGNKKFETTTEGVTITGSVGNNNLQVDGDALVIGGLTAGGLSYPTSVGTSGQALISDGAGNVNWGSVATTGLQSRTTAQVTQSIANNTAANVSFTTPKTYALLKIETSHAAWVTLYSDTASRTADSTRNEQTDPTPGSGVLAEVITAGGTTQLITPGTICFNSNAIGTTYAKIVNKSGTTNNITVTLTYVQIEA